MSAERPAPLDVERLASIIRRTMVQGEWLDRLPSERSVMDVMARSIAAAIAAAYREPTDGR